MSRLRTAVLAGTCFLIGVAGPADARVWHVPTEAATVAAAVDSATAGDVIELAPGAYHERNLVLGSGLTIRSEDPASMATIDAGGADSIFEASLQSDIALVDLVVTGGLYYNGAAARFFSCHGIEIRGCTFVANRTTSGIGGALQVSGDSSILIADCLFENNDAPLDDGGAIWLSCPVAEIVRCTFVANHAINGASISCSGQDIRITECVFAENSAGNGAGLDLRGDAVVITDCLFVGNAATRGGAAACWNDATPVFTGCTMVNNTASSQGGGLYCTGDAVATVERSIIAFNAGGGAVACASGGSASLACSDVYGNVGGDWTGCLADQAEIDGNFSLDPDFCPPSGDAAWALSSGSPCLPGNSPCGELVGAYGLGCGATGVPAATANAPLLRLLGNHPNPFNPNTVIAFDLQRPAAVGLRIYSLSGRLVRELAAGERFAAGRHHRRWDGRDARGRALAAGTYVYRVTTGAEEATGSMLLLK